MYFNVTDIINDASISKTITNNAYLTGFIFSFSSFLIKYIKYPYTKSEIINPIHAYKLPENNKLPIWIIVSGPKLIQNPLSCIDFNCDEK